MPTRRESLILGGVAAAAAIAGGVIGALGLQAGGGYAGPTRSPDRADACVWALSELARPRAAVPRIRAL